MTDPEPAGTRSGRLIVVIMVLGIAGILALFNHAVTLFGPPEAAMPIHFASDFPGEVDVLVRAEGELAWSVLFGGQRELPLSRGEDRSVQLLAGEPTAWWMAFHDGERSLGLVAVESRPGAQLGLRLDPEGRLFRRDGASSLPLARQLHLPEFEVDAPEGAEVGQLEAALGPDTPEAVDTWALGPPRPDS